MNRRHAGVWLTQILTQPNDVVESSCLGLHLTLYDLYAGVDLPPPGVAESDAESEDVELLS